MTISGLLPDFTQQVTVHVTDGKISGLRLEPASIATESAQVLCPGFIDAQVNGLGGIAFNDPALTTRQVELVTEQLWSTGVVGYLPTLITDSFENHWQSVQAIARARRDSRVGLSILGIHLEGPYLSPQDGPRGAHPLAHVRPPDWNEFQRLQDASENLIRLITIAPETAGAIQFIRQAVAQGVRVAIGHTAADSDAIRAAIDAGACMSTHLGNAAHDQLQRHRNYVYDQLAADELWASLIVDGHHLPPDLVKVFVRAKCPERVILVSDAAMWAGLLPGVYPWGHCQVEVRADGWIGVVGQPRLAGSGLLLCRGIENIVRFADVSLAQAVHMATSHPAKMLGIKLPNVAPQIGDDATFTLVDWNRTTCTMKVQQTIVRGETLYAAA